jgi:hypothetical protein
MGEEGRVSNFAWDASDVGFGYCEYREKAKARMDTVT